MAIAGAAEVHYVETARGLFIAIIFFSCLGALVFLLAKVGRRSAATNKYQVGSSSGTKQNLLVTCNVPTASRLVITASTLPLHNKLPLESLKVQTRQAVNEWSA